MACKIIGRMHNVTSYTLNGRPQHVVEPKEDSIDYINYRVVMDAIDELGTNDWVEISNYLDDVLGEGMSNDKRLLKMVDRLCECIS